MVGINENFWKEIESKYCDTRHCSIVLGGNGWHAEMRCKEEDIKAFVGIVMFGLKRYVVNGWADEYLCFPEFNFSDESDQLLSFYKGRRDCEVLNNAMKMFIDEDYFNVDKFDVGFSAVKGEVEVGGDSDSVVDFLGRLLKFQKSSDRKIVIEGLNGSTFTVIKE